MKRTLAVLIVAFSSACARRLDFGPSGRVDDPYALLALNAEVEGRVRALKSDARLSVKSDAARGSVPVFAAAQLPDRMYLEVQDFFGKPQAVLSTDGATAGLYRADEGTYASGPATAENASRLLPLVLPPGHWVALLMGRPPKVQGRASVSFDAEVGTYRLELAGEGGERQTLWVDPVHHRVVRSEVRGDVSYDVVYGDFDRSPARFPREVHLTSHSPPGALDVSLKGPELNPDFEEGLFEPQAPPGARSIPL